MTDYTTQIRLRIQAIINGEGPTVFPRQYRCVRSVNVRDCLRAASDDCKREFVGSIGQITLLRTSSAQVQMAEIDRYLQEEQHDT